MWRAEMGIWHYQRFVSRLIWGTGLPAYEHAQLCVHQKRGPQRDGETLLPVRVPGTHAYVDFDQHLHSAIVQHQPDRVRCFLRVVTPVWTHTSSIMLSL